MPRDNNFDLLRLLFASMVVLYHCHDLSLSPAYWWVPYVASSRIAVEGFFAMSGCLIVGSYDRDPALGRYFEKRGRRLLPAYLAALAFTLVLGFWLSATPVSGLLRAAGTYQYIFANLSFCNFLHPSFPGLFTHNPMPAVNGALWTIKVEIMFYLMVPLIVRCGNRFGRWRTLGSIFLLSVAYRVLCSRLNLPSLAIQLPGQLCFFAVGALTYYYYPWFLRHRRWMSGVAIGSYLVSSYSGWIAFRAIGGALGGMCLGLLAPYFRGPTRFGDFSYGTYVFHFPVVQTFISLGILSASPYWGLAAIFLTVSLLAIASWYFVEKPFLTKRQAGGRGTAGVIAPIPIAAGATRPD